MSKLLTPQEALQAIADGKNLEFKEPDGTSWRPFTIDKPIFVRSVVNGIFMFRLAQEMITIGDVSFPKPVSEPLEEGTRYWSVEPASKRYTDSFKWGGDIVDEWLLRRGLIHLSEENAVAHAKALIELSGGKL